MLFVLLATPFNSTASSAAILPRPSNGTSSRVLKLFWSFRTTQTLGKLLNVLNSINLALVDFYHEEFQGWSLTSNNEFNHQTSNDKFSIVLIVLILPIYW